MSQSGRPLLRNVYNQNAYFSGNGVRTSLVAPVLQVFPRQRTYETQEWNPWTWDLLYRPVVGYRRPNGQDQLVESEGTVQSREIRAKKTPGRRGPEQSKVKWYQKTSLWLMCCKFMKWITVVITVNIQINRPINSWVNNYLLSGNPKTRHFGGKQCGGMPKSRNSGPSSEESFPRQRNETITSVARLRLGEPLSATVNLGYGGNEKSCFRDNG
jgi:hypothetical protein